MHVELNLSHEGQHARVVGTMTLEDGRWVLTGISTRWGTLDLTLQTPAGETANPGASYMAPVNPQTTNPAAETAVVDYTPLTTFTLDATKLIAKLPAGAGFTGTTNYVETTAPEAATLSVTIARSEPAEDVEPETEPESAPPAPAQPTIEELRENIGQRLARARQAKREAEAAMAAQGLQMPSVPAPTSGRPGASARSKTSAAAAKSPARSRRA